MMLQGLKANFAQIELWNVLEEKSGLDDTR